MGSMKESMVGAILDPQVNQVVEQPGQTRPPGASWQSEKDTGDEPEMIQESCKHM